MWSHAYAQTPPIKLCEDCGKKCMVDSELSHHLENDPVYCVMCGVIYISVCSETNIDVVMYNFG